MDLKFLIICLFCLTKVNGELSTEDRILIKELRERIAKNSGAHGIPVEKEAQSFLKSMPDGIIYNWVSYYDGNLDKAEENMLKTIIWRQANYIEEDDGTPILFVPGGIWDLRSVLKSGPRNDVIKFLIYMIETLTKAIVEDVDHRFTKERNGTVIGIVDLENLSISQVTSIRVLGTLAAAFGVFQTHYPFMHQLITFINTPSIFSAVLDVIKSAFSNKSMNRIKVFGHQKFVWEKYLKSVIPENVYPNELKNTL